MDVKLASLREFYLCYLLRYIITSGVHVAFSLSINVRVQTLELKFLLRKS